MDQGVQLYHSSNFSTVSAISVKLLNVGWSSTYVFVKQTIKNCASKRKLYIFVALLHCSVYRLSNRARMIEIWSVNPEVLYPTIDLEGKNLALRKQGTKFGNTGKNGHLGDFKERQLCKCL